MRTTLIVVALTTFAAGTVSTPLDRWAAAIGGRDTVAGVTTLYREATINVGGTTGWIKAWHTATGKYRKEEQIGAFATIETFDGRQGFVQQGTAASRAMGPAELPRARSVTFANANAMFFAFFPERHAGSRIVDGDTVILRPEGGIDWVVTLDRETSLPRQMSHRQGDRTITVTFTAHETVDGITLEREIRRATGDPRYDAVIRFTKTVLNMAMDETLFTLATSEGQSQ